MSHDLVDDLCTQIDEELDAADKRFREIEKGSSLRDPTQDLQELNEDLKNITNIIGSLKIEARQLDNHREYKSTYKAYEAHVKEIRKKMKWLQAEKKIDKSTGDEDNMTKQEAIDYGHTLMDETDMALTNAKKYAVQIEDEGQQALETLDKQRTQMEDTLEETYKIEDEMKRARKITTIMLRRVMTDQVMWCLVGLIIIALIAVIAMMG